MGRGTGSPSQLWRAASRERDLPVAMRHGETPPDARPTRDGGRGRGIGHGEIVTGFMAISAQGFRGTAIYTPMARARSSSRSRAAGLSSLLLMTPTMKAPDEDVALATALATLVTMGSSGRVACSASLRSSLSPVSRGSEPAPGWTLGVGFCTRRGSERDRELLACSCGARGGAGSDLPPSSWHQLLGVQTYFPSRQSYSGASNLSRQVSRSGQHHSGRSTVDCEPDSRHESVA